jgi:hypothetical protein
MTMKASRKVEVTDEAVQCSATHPNIDGGAPCRYLAGHTEAGLPHTTANGFFWHDDAALGGGE